MSKLIKLYTFNMCNLLCNNYISVSCLKKSRDLSEVLRKILERFKNVFPAKRGQLTWDQLPTDNLKNCFTPILSQPFKPEK